MQPMPAIHSRWHQFETVTSSYRETNAGVCFFLSNFCLIRTVLNRQYRVSKHSTWFLSLTSQDSRSMTSQQCDQVNNQVAQVTSQIYSLQVCENERLVRELHTIERKIQDVQQHLDAVSIVDIFEGPSSIRFFFTHLISDSFRLNHLIKLLKNH